MEIALMAMTSLGGTAAAAGATAATAGASFAAAGSTALTMLQGAGTVFSALSSISAGNAAAAESKSLALQADFESRNEYIEGRETAAALKEDLAKTMGNQAVAFAAGGVDLGSVSVGVAKQQAIDDAENELSINFSSSVSRSLAQRRQARNYRSRAVNQRKQGYVQAVGKVANFGMSVAKRA